MSKPHESTTSSPTSLPNLIGSGRYLLHLGSALLIGALLMLWGLSLLNRVRPAPIVLQPPPPTVTPLPTGTPAPVRVYVSGEVVEPGVYALPAGQIVEQAIATAGGLTADALAEGVNLAQPLYDGLQIYVPAQTEQAAVTAALTAAATPSGVRRVDLNTADLAELETLPGIGPSMAQRIVDYRKEVGRFQTIDDLLNVRGIGEAKLAQIRDLVTVSDP